MTYLLNHVKDNDYYNCIPKEGALQIMTSNL